MEECGCTVTRTVTPSFLSDKCDDVGLGAAIQIVFFNSDRRGVTMPQYHSERVIVII